MRAWKLDQFELISGSVTEPYEVLFTYWCEGHMVDGLLAHKMH